MIFRRNFSGFADALTGTHSAYQPARMHASRHPNPHFSPPRFAFYITEIRAYRADCVTVNQLSAALPCKSANTGIKVGGLKIAYGISDCLDSFHRKRKPYPVQKGFIRNCLAFLFFELLSCALLQLLLFILLLRKFCLLLFKAIIIISKFR